MVAQARGCIVDYEIPDRQEDVGRAEQEGSAILIKKVCHAGGMLRETVSLMLM